MRWDTMIMQDWEEYASYIDTICIPIAPTQLNKNVTGFLHWVRVMNEIGLNLERKLTGRLLLLPMIPYRGENKDIFLTYLKEIITQLSNLGFHYFILLFHYRDKEISEEFTQQYGDNLAVSSYFTRIKVTASVEEMEAEAQFLYQQILHIWDNL
jgi:hypothetical protein